MDILRACWRATLLLSLLPRALFSKRHSHSAQHSKIPTAKGTTLRRQRNAPKILKDAYLNCNVLPLLPKFSWRKGTLYTKASR
ncbi:hypothetical protein B0H14DRAFT_2812428 [Mycena olivaceomarginata]|nr:hypothetical protein B0H14DRAFT_2812428 [Mycena olivaceomarginata]